MEQIQLVLFAGQGCGVQVLVFAGTGAEVVGMVGVMRAGAAYVPLEPTLPAERLQYLVAQCGCRSIVAQGKWEELVWEEVVASLGQNALEMVVVEETMPIEEWLCIKDPARLKTVSSKAKYNVYSCCYNTSITNKTIFETGKMDSITNSEK